MTHTHHRPPATPPAPPPLSLSRHWVWLAYGSLVLLTLFLTVPWRVGVGDTWGAVVQGRYILAHGLPQTDPFSYTAPSTGQPLVIHEWLGNVLFALTYDAAGMAGLVALKVLLVSLTLGLMVHTAHSLGASLGVTTLMFGLLCWMVWASFVERMYLFSSLGLTAYLWLYVHVRQRKGSPHWLWLLVPGQALWANLHGGHVQGLVLLGIFGCGEGMAWARARYGGARVDQALPGRLVVHFLLLPVFAMAAACVTPYGWGLLVQPLREAAMERALALQEQTPVNLRLAPTDVLSTR